MTIQLKVGYRYRTHGGVVVDIYEYDYDFTGKFADFPECADCYWDIEGNHCISDYIYATNSILTITEEVGPTPEE